MPTLTKQALARALDFIQSASVATAALDQERTWLRNTVEAALKPKRSAAPAKKRRESKRTSQRKEMADIREAVVARSGGGCEACGAPGSDADHFFGGSGRRRALQSAETVWFLCSTCHRQKTNNIPSPLYWLSAFEQHATARGFTAAAEMARRRGDVLEMQGRGG